MAEKTMEEILVAAKKAKTAVDSEKIEIADGETFDLANLTLEQKLKLRKAANNPANPNYQIWLQLSKEKMGNWQKIDKKDIKNLSEDDKNE